MVSVSVIIPCLNEAAGIGSVIQAIGQEALEIIVIDNGSSDASAEIARSLGAHVIEEKRRGYGRALRTGFAIAKGDILVTIDADNQYPAADIASAVAYLSAHNLDFVTCSRFPLVNKKSMHWVRRCGNYFLTAACNILFGLSLADSQSGMMCFKRSLLPTLQLEGASMELSMELKIKAATHKELRYAEMPIGYSVRSGHSKLLPLKHGFGNLLYACRLRCRMLTNPLQKL